MNKFEPVKKYTQEIDSWEGIVVTSVLAAIGVNLVVSGIASLYAGQYAIWLLTAGICIIIGTIYLYFHRRQNQLENKEYISGFVLMDKREKEIVHVPEYEISMLMWEHMKAVTDGDEEIRKAWNDLDRVEEVRYSEEKAQYVINHSEAYYLIWEMLEYFIIEALSTTLTTYFEEFNNDEIDAYYRDNIPDLLEENRILKWISDEKSELRDKIDTTGEILKNWPPLKAFIRSKDGTYLFSRFELKLPKNSTIESKKHKISIKHPYFTIDIESYLGSDVTLPHGFAEYYLGIKEDDANYKAIHFCVAIHVSFRLRALLFKGWRKYVLWIDRFIDSLREQFSEDLFFEKINWETAYTIMQCEKKVKKE